IASSMLRVSFFFIAHTKIRIILTDTYESNKGSIGSSFRSCDRPGALACQQRIQITSAFPFLRQRYLRVQLGLHCRPVAHEEDPERPWHCVLPILVIEQTHEDGGLEVVTLIVDPQIIGGSLAG